MRFILLTPSLFLIFELSYLALGLPDRLWLIEHHALLSDGYFSYTNLSNEERNSQIGEYLNSRISNESFIEFITFNGLSDEDYTSSVLKDIIAFNTIKAFGTNNVQEMDNKIIKTQSGTNTDIGSIFSSENISNFTIFKNMSVIDHREEYDDHFQDTNTNTFSQTSEVLSDPNIKNKSEILTFAEIEVDIEQIANHFNKRWYKGERYRPNDIRSIRYKIREDYGKITDIILLWEHNEIISLINNLGYFATSCLDAKYDTIFLIDFKKSKLYYDIINSKDVKINYNPNIRNIFYEKCYVVYDVIPKKLEYENNRGFVLVLYGLLFVIVMVISWVEKHCCKDKDSDESEYCFARKDYTQSKQDIVSKED